MEAYVHAYLHLSFLSVIKIWPDHEFALQPGKECGKFIMKNTV